MICKPWCTNVVALAFTQFKFSSNFHRFEDAIEFSFAYLKMKKERR